MVDCTVMLGEVAAKYPLGRAETVGARDAGSVALPVEEVFGRQTAAGARFLTSAPLGQMQGQFKDLGFEAYMQQPERVIY